MKVNRRKHICCCGLTPLYCCCQANRYLSQYTLIFSTHCIRASVLHKRNKKQLQTSTLPFMVWLLFHSFVFLLSFSFSFSSRPKVGTKITFTSALKCFLTLSSASFFFSFSADIQSSKRPATVGCSIKCWMPTGCVKLYFSRNFLDFFFYIYCCPFGPTRAQFCQGIMTNRSGTYSINYPSLCFALVAQLFT